MNSFIKNNKQFFSLVLGVFLSSSLGAITVNDKPLEDIINPGQVLVATVEEKDKIVVLEMVNGDLAINQFEVDRISNLKLVFQQVKGNTSGCISSRTCNLSSNILNYNSSYLMGREDINIQARFSLNFIRCLLESPLINITGNTMNFDDCFLINPHVLNIMSNSTESNYKSIHILFYDQHEYPIILDGKIDLKDNKTPQKLIFSNVKEIRIHFNPQVWN